MSAQYSRRKREVADREGFEPPVPVKVRLISSQVHSTGLCHLSASGCDALAPNGNPHRSPKSIVCVFADQVKQAND